MAYLDPNSGSYTSGGATSQDTFRRIQQQISQQQANTGRPVTTDEMTGLIEPLLATNERQQVQMESLAQNRKIAEQGQAIQSSQFNQNLALQQQEFQAQQQAYQDQQAANKVSGYIQGANALGTLGILGYKLGGLGAGGSTVPASIPGAGAVTAEGGTVNLPVGVSGGGVGTAGSTGADVTAGTGATMDISWLASSGYLALGAVGAEVTGSMLTGSNNIISNLGWGTLAAATGYTALPFLNQIQSGRWSTSGVASQIGSGSSFSRSSLNPQNWKL